MGASENVIPTTPGLSSPTRPRSASDVASARTGLAASVECVAAASRCPVGRRPPLSRRVPVSASPWRGNIGRSWGSQRTPTIETDTLLAAAAELRETLRHLPLSIELPGTAAARDLAISAVRQLDDYVLPRAARHRRAGPGRRRRLDRGGQVDAREQPGRLGGVPTRRPPSDHPLPGAGAPPLRRALVRGRSGAPGLARVRGGPGGQRPHRAGRSRHRARDARPARRAGHRLGRRRQPRTRRAAAGVGRSLAVRHDRRPLRRRRALGVPASRRARGVGIGLVLNRIPPGAADEIGPTWRRCCAPKAWGGADVRRRRAAPARRAAARSRRCSRSRPGSAHWPPISGRGPSSSAAPLSATIGELAVRSERVAVAVEYQDEMLGWLGDGRRRSIGPCGTSPSTSATAPCCAGRSWPAGRTSSAPASCSASCSRPRPAPRPGAVGGDGPAAECRPLPGRDQVRCRVAAAGAGDAGHRRDRGPGARSLPVPRCSASGPRDGVDLTRPPADLAGARAAAGPRLAGRAARPAAPRGRRPAGDRQGAVLRGERRGPRADGRGVRPDRWAHGCRDRHRRWGIGRRPEAPRGPARGPGGAPAHRGCPQRPRPPCAALLDAEAARFDAVPGVHRPAGDAASPSRLSVRLRSGVAAEVAT